MSTDIDQAHMRRAIALAHQRRGSTWPNPVVGCVIARGAAVLTEAVTGPGGADSAARRVHAEEQALIALGGSAPGATAYVTLEPCGSRSSAKASCADRLIAAKVARVVVASLDPSPLAASAGLARLREGAIEVSVGLLADEAADLYAGYRRRLATGHPLVEAADSGRGFDAPFALEAGESPTQALDRLGRIGFMNVWVQRGGPFWFLLQNQGLLD